MSTGQELAKKKNELIKAVEGRVHRLVQNHELQLPENYSAANALKSAWLILQEVKDKNKKPALEVCSQASVMNALFSMVVQGLNPEKKQGYFIVYGRSLVFQRSYFGAVAIAKRMADVQDVYAEIVYEGDDLEYEIHRGNKVITKHTQRLENINGQKIKAAYAVISFNDPARPDYTDLMTIEQIRQSWTKSKMNPDKPDSTHSQFPDEMCRKTVLNRALKIHINSSSDDHLFLDEFNRSGDDAVELAMDDEIEESANDELLDIDTDDYVEEDDRTIDMEDYEDTPEADEDLEDDREPVAAGAQGKIGPGF